MGAARVYTMSDDDYFLGLVALLNSLRITGNDLPVTVFDIGMSAEQRMLVEAHCEVVTAARDRHPFFLKPIMPLGGRDDVIVLIDADVIVTGDLAGPLGIARGGQVFAFSAGQHWYPEWAELFGLRAPLREERYVNAGFVAFSRSGVPGLLERWAQICDDLARGAGAGYTIDGSRGVVAPLALADEAVLNALLMSEVPAGRVTRGRSVVAPMHPGPLAATRVVDERALRCERDGEAVLLLHAIGPRKPWQASAARDFRRTAYTRCLVRLLTGPELAVRVPPDRIPPWLRSGPRGAAQRWALHAYDLPARLTRPARHSVARRLRVMLSPRPGLEDRSA